MKYLHEAMRRVSSLPRRAITTFLAVLGVALLPAMSLASEGDVVLNFSGKDKNYLWISLVFGFIALGVAAYLIKTVLAVSPGSAKMQEVGLAIKEGALAYLGQQIKLMLVFVVLLSIGLFFIPNFHHNIFVPIAFIAGVAASYIAGYTGMVMAVNGNMRTANAALSSYKRALEVAFRSGAVAGMVTVGMGLIGATTILLLAGSDSMTLLVGFGFGGSLAALFMRVGGGIFTKAADVGADLVGKVEAGIPEDDPRNPATIADNVGDNVGDCAGMAADIFESYEVTLVAAIVLGAATSAIFDQATWMKLILFALMARGIGIIASIAGVFSVRGSDDIDSDPLKAIRKGFYASAFIALIFTAGLAYFMMGGQKGSEIRTTELITPQDLQETQRNLVMTARQRLATERKVSPWQVPTKDLAALPELNSIGPAGGVPNPGMTPEQQKNQEIDRLVQDAETRKQSNTGAPERLRGYTPISQVAANNPVLGYAMNKIARTTEESKTIQSSPDPLTTIKEARDAGLLDLVFIRVVETPAAQPSSPTPPTAQTFFAGPFYRGLAEDYQKKPPAPTVKITDIYPATVYADANGDLAVASTMSDKDFSQFRAVGQFTSFYRATKAEVQAADKLAKDPKTAENAPVPPRSPVQVAKVQNTEVPWWTFAAAIGFGILMAFAIEFLTDYYVSTHKKPTQEVAGVSNAGAAPMIIQGFAYAMESSVFMVFALVITLLFPLFIFAPTTYGGYILSFYGIALVGLGLLTTTGYVLAMDTFGPISDNAQGVYEMSGEGHDNEMGSKAVQRLDAAGNTTKALTKGFAIATAVVAAVALFHSYLEDAHLATIGLRLDVPEIFLGMLIGAAAPFLFSAFAINAVGRASFQLINEVRRQFRNDPGIMAGTSKPDYAACVAIVTAAAQKELLGPGILAIALPIAVAFGFSIGKAPVEIGGHLYNLTGAQALGGFLAGAIASGQLLAVLLANSGGMWDNAKKIIEDGLYGGKGTDAHKAGVVCDTVGDPFKDTAGPALNPLIKVMNLVALLLAGVIVQPFGNATLATITIIALVALGIAIYVSKKGSLSSEMQKVTDAASAQAEHEKGISASAVEAPVKTTKKRITVEDDEPTDPA